VSIVDGRAGRGGGILNEGTLNMVDGTLSDNWVSGCSTSECRGAGIYSTGTLTVENSTFIQNRALGGAGSGIYNSGTATVEGCRFRDHSGVNLATGGGIHNDGMLTVRDCTFDLNRIDRDGGAIYNSLGSEALLENSLFVANSAGLGGAIYNRGILTIDGCTFGDPQGDPFETGNSAVNGGAIRNGDKNDGGGTLDISASSFHFNQASDGGGAISNQGGTVTLTGSLLQDNSVGGTHTGGGGAISSRNAFNVSGSELTVIDSRFHSNFSSEAGGAINDRSATTIIRDSTFTENSASAGGGIRVRYTQLTITDSTFSNNDADGSEFTPEDGGGAIHAEFADATISNSTFSGNIADTDVISVGGAINNLGNSLVMTNCTVAYNVADVGGGLYNDEGASATLVNTLVAANFADGCTVPCGNCYGDPPTAQSNHNLSDTGSCGSSFLQRTMEEIHLGLLADNGGPAPTHALLPGSAAIDMGDPATCAASPINGLDQRGLPRPVDGDGDSVAVCDIGAVEDQATPIQSTLYVDADATGVNDGTNWVDAFVRLGDALARRLSRTPRTCRRARRGARRASL